MYRTLIASIIYTLTATATSTVAAQEIMPDSSLVADTVVASAESDSLVFDLPEGMVEDIDSLLNNWQGRHLLKKGSAEEWLNSTCL